MAAASEKYSSYYFHHVCRTCPIASSCFPSFLKQCELDQLEHLVRPIKSLKAKDVLFRQGDYSKSIFMVRSGCLKAMLIDEDGEHQIVGFYLPGEVVGLDALDDHQHDSTAMATTPSEVCTLPKSLMEFNDPQIPRLRNCLMGCVSDELGRDHKLMLMVSRRNVDQRIAIFLLNIHERLQKTDPSEQSNVIPINRGDMANYLGISIETCSRVISKLRTRNILKTEKRMTRLVDIKKLQAIAEEI